MTPFVVLLASQLPDPGQTSIAPLLGALGCFVGGLVAHLLGASDAARTRAMANGSFIGFGIGAVLWSVVFTTDRL